MAGSVNEERLVDKVRKDFVEVDPSVSGFVRVEAGSLVGDIVSSVLSESDVKKIADSYDLKSSVTVSSSNLLVTSKSSDGVNEYAHDEVEKKWEHKAEVKIIHQGFVPVSMIQSNLEYKILHPKNVDKARGPIQEFKVISPVILDKNLRVIDGDLRLELAVKEGFENIPAMILDLDGDVEKDRVIADGLRLFLNRSSEFQRWNYEHVDPYIDKNVTLQPILEPLGLFSNRILPVTFFANAILKYEIDEYNDQQKTYKQEEGIAAWAKLMREREEERKRKIAEKRKPKKDSSEYTPLLDMKPKDEDFMETADLKEEMDKTVSEEKEMAATVTENYDAIMRKKKEAAGTPWQAKKRRGVEVVEAKRKSSLDKAAKKLEKAFSKNSDSVSEDLKSRVENLLDGDNKYEFTEKDIDGLLKEVEGSNE